MVKEPVKKIGTKKPVMSRKGNPTAAPKMLQKTGHQGMDPDKAAVTAEVAGRVGESRTSLIAHLWQTTQHKPKLLKGWKNRKKR